MSYDLEGHSQLQGFSNVSRLHLCSSLHDFNWHIPVMRSLSDSWASCILLYIRDCIYLSIFTANCKGPTFKGREVVKREGWEGRGVGIREEGREGDPKSWFTPPMSDIMKNTLIAELMWLVGVATQTFAPGVKHPHAATV